MGACRRDVEDWVGKAGTILGATWPDTEGVWVRKLLVWCNTQLGVGNKQLKSQPGSWNPFLISPPLTQSAACLQQAWPQHPLQFCPSLSVCPYKASWAGSAWAACSLPLIELASPWTHFRLWIRFWLSSGASGGHLSLTWVPCSCHTAFWATPLKRNVFPAKPGGRFEWQFNTELKKQFSTELVSSSFA